MENPVNPMSVCKASLNKLHKSVSVDPYFLLVEVLIFTSLLDPHFCDKDPTILHVRVSLWTQIFCYECPRLHKSVMANKEKV